MGKRNGKRNGKRVMHANSLKNLKPFEKGNNANPSGLGRRKGLFASLEKYFDEVVTEERDGETVQSERVDVLARIVGGAALRGPRHDTNDPNWRSCVQAVFDRLAPIPREPSVLIGNVSVEHTTVAVSFVDQVREKAGRDSVTSDDVLKALEQETFGDGNSNEG